MKTISIELDQDECYCLTQHLTTMLFDQLQAEPSMEEWRSR